jgi:hypothetical protein
MMILELQAGNQPPLDQIVLNSLFGSNPIHHLHIVT